MRSMMGMDGERGEGSGVGVAVEGGERGEQGEGGGGGGGILGGGESEGDEEEEEEVEEGEAGSWGGHVLQLKLRSSLKKSLGVKI